MAGWIKMPLGMEVGLAPGKATGNSRESSVPKILGEIPGNFEDFPKLSFFLDSDGSILRKTRLFQITFR